jgi:hypothetical protein
VFYTSFLLYIVPTLLALGCLAVCCTYFSRELKAASPVSGLIFPVYIVATSVRSSYKP